MYLQVVLMLNKTKQTKVAIVEAKANPSMNYFQIERKVRPQVTKLLGHRDYTILYMYVLSDEELDQILEKHSQ